MIEPQEVPDVIRAEHIVKSYGAVKALRDINMHLVKGEVLGLVGDNGAGKSTFIKILTGFVQPDDGKIFINGEEVKLRSVTYARSLGIETVYQDLALVNELTVYHNMFLKREVLLKPFPLLNNRVMREQAHEYLKKIGVNIQSVDTEVAKLSGGQRQAIAIARAVYSNAKIIMIAHNYGQVFEICDRVNLLQHGTITLDKRIVDTALDELNELVMREYRIAATSSQ